MISRLWVKLDWNLTVVHEPNDFPLPTSIHYDEHSMRDFLTDLTRRHFMRNSMFAVAAVAAPKPLLASANPNRLIASAAESNLVNDLGPRTAVAAYNRQVPGPLLRFRQGDRFRLELENQLDEPTTIHWHGLRVPADMDGVPYLSQVPVNPGEVFMYDFDLHDAGTFWYHPHFNSSQQIGQGLRGVLVVEERHPPVVDRDVVWVLDDWRLDENAQIVAFNRNLRDAGHNGRIGNVVTVNGSINDEFAVTPGERIRLRLVNVANARTFALKFNDLNPWVIALDGHPIDPFQSEQYPVVLGAGQRADLIMDISGSAGDATSVTDEAYGNNFTYELMRLIRDRGAVKSAETNQPPQRLSANPVTRPDLDNAERHQIIFEGGAMGGLEGAYLDDEYRTMRELVELQKLWSVNGQISSEPHQMAPLLTLRKGKSVILDFVNRTAFEHPIHLHGHSFEIIRNDGSPDVAGSIRDTILIQPQKSAQVAFVADNPGQWMLHCHILEHQEFGMTTVIAVV